MTQHPTLDISTASSRKQEKWHVEQWPWSKLVQKLSVTHRTAETYAIYISAPKPRQAEIKDIGGFVGGYLENGIRSKTTIKHRQLLTLDIDFGYAGLWEDFTMFFSNEALIYSTHAHSVVAPRLRLVIPLTRPVGREEYEAVGRRVADMIGMKHVDRTTFEPERMMFWPSTAKDGDFYFRRQEGEWLDPDAVLSEYRDWKNVAEWPLCPTENEIIHSSLKKQQDPAEKEGMIGAFCRAYPISEAIDNFIPETYTPCGDDRYTYCEGTTAAGAICYEDKWLYSHHSTDPVSGMLCNAFDLVRIHKYGSLDDDPSLSPSKRPSFMAMTQLARTDPAVIKEVGLFNLDPAVAGDWVKKLEMTGKGEWPPTIDNLSLIMQNDINLKGKFMHNDFDHRIYIEKTPAEEEEKGEDILGGRKTRGEMREFSDDEEAELRRYVEKTYNIYHTAKTQDAFRITCRQNSFHPIREYLDNLVWDEVPRLDTLFIDQLGVPDTPYARAVTRKALVAAVARVHKPGCKFDHMTVLVGAQGKGKSSLLHDLGQDWFSDTLNGVTGNDAYMQIQGVWLLEVAELSATKKSEEEAVKNFITKREDRFRIPFAKHFINAKRQLVLFGSTNQFSFLRDNTGNRRYWPLVVLKKYQPGSIDPDPIWAEAVYRFKEGETLYLDEQMEAAAYSQQLEHTEEDERAGMIASYLDMRVPEDWEEKNRYERVSYVGAYEEGVEGVLRDRICAAEIWCELFRLDLKDMSSYKTKFIHNIMGSMAGWKRVGTMNYKKYGVQRSYVRVGSIESVAMSTVTVDELLG